MKCLVSKNSVLKSAILTLVSVLCFAGVSVGQTYEIIDRDGDGSIVSSFVQNFDGCSYYKVKNNNQYNDKAFRVKKDGSYMTADAGHDANWKWKSEDWGGRVYVISGGNSVYVKLCGDNISISLNRPSELPESTSPWLVEPFKHNGDQTNCLSGTFESCKQDEYICFVETTNNSGVYFQITRDGDVYDKSYFTNSQITQEDWGAKFWKYEGGGFLTNEFGKKGIWVIIKPKQGSLTFSNSEKPNCGNKVASASIIGSSSVCLEGVSALSASYEIGSGSFTPKYQWYKDDVEITNATNSSYLPTSIGIYKVRIYAGDDNVSNSALSGPVSVTGPVVSTVVLSADNTAFCVGNTRLSVDDDASCSPSGYPQYAWYKEGALVETTTTNSYSPSSAGNWKVVVMADASTSKESNIIPLTAPNPTISVSTSDLSLPAVVSGDAYSESISVSLNNSCSTLKIPVITGTNASMYSVIDNGDGTYTITFTPGDKAGSYPASVTFASNDDATPQTITLKGKVVSCMSSNVATFDFDNQGLGTSNGVTLSTSMTNQTSQNWDPGYKIGSGNKTFYGGQGTMSDNSGNCFQFYYKDKINDQNVLTITAGTSIDATAYYGIEFLIGEAGTNGKTGEVYGEVYIDGEKVGEVKYLSSTTIRTVFSGADLQEGKSIVVKGVNHTTDGNTPANCYVYYIDNLKLSKVCPPEIEFSTISGECDVNPSFTAEVTKGSADVAKYEWYVLEEGEAPLLVATHNSSSLNDVFSQSAEIGTGKKVKVVVTDANGLSADVEYEINCGPVINDITVPSEICPNGNLSMAVPTYTSSSTVIDEGWEIAESATATRSEWTELSSLNSVPETYKNWYIRYFVENDEGRGKSNAVQITMFDAPVVDPISVDDICVGNTFDLTAPNVDYDATKVSERWQYSTQADFSGATAFTSGETFNTAGTYYMRYVATDACTTAYATTTAKVNDPSLSVTEYRTYMRVAGTEQIVADAPVLDAICIGDLVYSLVDEFGDEATYPEFSIDDETGVITMTEQAKVADDYQIFVKITDGNETVIQELTITLTEEPTLELDCPSSTDYYAYTKYQKLNIQNVVTSNFVNDNVMLELTGSAASYFELSSSEVTKNTANVPVTIAQSDFFTSVGDYTLKLTATTEGLTQECNVNIHTKSLSINEYINDQTNCSSDAPLLMVEVTGEDATNLPLTYQWYNNGIAVSGATSKTFKPTVDGDYYCEVSTGGTLLHKSKSANVFFVKNMPVLSFDETAAPIPSEVFCTQEVGAVMKVTLNGADVTSDYKRYWWLIGSESDGLTSDNIHTFSFDCASNDYTATIGAYIMENTTKCVIKTTKPITIKAMNKIYSYYGATGDASDVTDRENWFTCKNSSGQIVLDVNPAVSDGHLTTMHEGTFYNQIGDLNAHRVEQVTCAMPPAANAFAEDGAQYIINKDNVKLKADQTWTVSGEGATVSIGDGNWTSNLSSVGGKWSKGSPPSYNNPNSYYEYSSSGVNGKNQLEAYTEIAEHDYRSQAKEFIIEGTLNTYDGIKLDVKTGSTLTIATDKGDFELGTLDPDRLTNQGGDANTFYHTCIKPSSSVTYTGDGAKNIRSGQYGQLYIDADEVAFEENADIKIIQVFKYDSDTDFDKINPNGSTISYIGSVNQDVASMPYYNLQLQGATEKTLMGNIDVESSFLIGQGVTCKAGDDTININGSGSDALVFEGKKFDCGTSTVNYKSTDETTVAAMSYYNLNLGTGNRTLQAKNIIGIAGTFQADDDATYVVDGSTVEFNGDGSVTQTIPAFKFNNLTINSSALEHNTSNSFNDAYNVTLQGDVDVANRLILTKGVLKTNGNVLEVSNTDADAVGQGYYTSTQDAAFIYGDLTRQFPANASSDGQMYYFPIGDKDGYKPFITSQITTTDVSEVTVGLSGGMSGTFSEADGGGNVSTLYSWHLTADDNYVDGRVAVSTSQGLNNANAVAYGTSTSGSNFENIYGSTSGNTIMYTQKKGAGYYSLVTRTIQSHKYYFNCSGTTDISDINAWYTQENGGGTVATSFDEPDAEWIIKCGTTISSPLAIMGANSKVTINIPKGESLKINSSAEFITATHEEGTIEIGKTGEMKIDYGFSMSDASISNRTTINNKGRLDLRNADIRLTNSNIINDGMLYSENVNWEMTSPANQGYKTAANDKHTKFINNGTVQMVNANFDVPRGGGGDGNIVHIRNAAGAVWLIDNTNASGAKHVDFNGCNFEHEDVGHGEIYVDFQCGSSFVVKKSDMKMVYGSAGMVQRIGGEIVVEDGNLFITRYSQTGGNFTLEQSCGAMYLTDTDKSGDGILQLQGGGGGYEVNIAGTMYVMGMVEQGGSGASFNVLDGGTVFIGNIGALMPAYSWQFTINIEDKGTLYYCGNRSAGPDNVGTNNGELFYAGSYYYDSDPVSEKDFKNTGVYNLMFVGEEDCMEQYWEGIPATDKTTLLPIELTMLYAVCNEQGEVELHWQTASETNNDYFTILRSFDGVHFEELDIVWGAGTTTEFHNYEYIDKDDNDGIVYYKLRQTDYDGNTTESKVIAVQTCGPNAQFRITEDQIDIFFNHPEESSFVVITSVTGQIFYSKSFKNIEAARIAAPQRKGVYIISVIDSKTITSEKFIR